MSDQYMSELAEQASNAARLLFLTEQRDALSASVIRLTDEKKQDADTIEYLRGQVENADDRIAALWDRAQTAEVATDHWAGEVRRRDGLIADLTTRLNLAVNLGRLVKVQADEWQEIAELLWEELQEWHAPKCPSIDLDAGTCTCHRILAAKWDEITNAGDWAHGPEDA